MTNSSASSMVNIFYFLKQFWSIIFFDNYFFFVAERDNLVPLVKKHKLLNINATAKYLMKHYTGPKLPDNSPIFDAPIMKTKDKEIFVRSIKDTLVTLFPSRDHFREDVSDGTGFLIGMSFIEIKKITSIDFIIINFFNFRSGLFYG